MLQETQTDVASSLANQIYKNKKEQQTTTTTTLSAAEDMCAALRCGQSAFKSIRYLRLTTYIDIRQYTIHASFLPPAAILPNSFFFAFYSRQERNKKERL